mmetsp:Transcript_23302/g.71371  ORF Transcript_23302/g.71371 Transcript_23302/m.71371 type:complete len:252 (-) Transcript_23302:122-877(-)
MSHEACSDTSRKLLATNMASTSEMRSFSAATSAQALRAMPSQSRDSPGPSTFPDSRSTFSTSTASSAFSKDPWSVCKPFAALLNELPRPDFPPHLSAAAAIASCSRRRSSFTLSAFNSLTRRLVASMAASSAPLAISSASRMRPRCIIAAAPVICGSTSDGSSSADRWLSFALAVYLPSASRADARRPRSDASLRPWAPLLEIMPVLPSLCLSPAREVASAALMACEYQAIAWPYSPLARAASASSSHLSS